MHPQIDRLESVRTRHRVAYQGRAVCWHQFGQGAPLVLVHGGHGNWMHWIRNIEALSRHHTLLIPDLPGFGESDDLDGDPHAPDRLQALIQALLGTLDVLVGRATLIDVAGFSFGGLVAAQLAVQRGGIQRVALLGAAGHGGQRREKAPQVNWRVANRTDMLAGLRHNLAAFMLHDPHSLDELAMAVHETACVQTRFRSKALSRAAMLQSVLARVGQPVLLLWGEHDVTAQPQTIAPELVAGCAAHAWCVVPGAGHWVQFERAGDVNRLLQSWFSPMPPVTAPGAF